MIGEHLPIYQFIMNAEADMVFRNYDDLMQQRDDILEHLMAKGPEDQKEIAESLKGHLVVLLKRLKQNLSNKSIVLKGSEVTEIQKTINSLKQIIIDLDEVIISAQDKIDSMIEISQRRPPSTILDEPPLKLSKMDSPKD